MISALQIAAALELPPPTQQQVAVIEAPLTPALVVAGAGSGKTETMANRVLWLLANRHVAAGQILGLTFTRKAAGELAERVRERIAALATAGLAPEHDPFDAPAISTYNSFANSLYRDHAILIGRESDGAVLGAAAAWQLARSVVVSSTDDRLAALGRRPDPLASAVLALSQALGENIVDAAEVRTFAARFASVADLPPGGRGEYAEVAALAQTVGSLDVLVGLAERFAAEKVRRGFVEYSDQVALALRIVRTAPQVREQLRAQYRVVLLDEYQDTSVVQTWLLSELFAGHPVMAVGDPNQSIYGWRGASAANLEQFAAQFGDGAVENFNLATSWRNGTHILEVANALVEPLRGITRVPVQLLQPGPAASSRPVDVEYSETLVDETTAVAAWLKAKLAEPGSRGDRSTAAILFRARKTQRAFVAALRDAGVPYHVLGVSGLLAEPEIADLVCALTVLQDPSAGSELLRLLGGSRWRLGVRDIRALRDLSRWLEARDYAQKPYETAVKDALRQSVADGEGGSLVDAVDFLAHARDGHSQLAAFSTEGLERLRDAGRTLSRLRSRAGLDLLDYVTLVVQELQLDIEVAANESRHGLAPLEAFFDALGSYLALDDGASLRGFLAWLREAEWRDGLAPRPEKPEPGTVQLLTVHAAKGLEWDHVAVPRWSTDEFPSKPIEGMGGWLGFGQLPWPFRGDAAELPEFLWDVAETRKGFLDTKKEFSALVAERHEREERRLAYVAVTRARHGLLLTGSFWAGTTRPRIPSPFLRSLAAIGVIGELPEAPQSDVNPLPVDDELVTWPGDPLGGRRDAVVAAADAVREATPGDAGRWQHDLDLLLAERAARLAGPAAIDIPTRVPASRFKDYVTDPAAVTASLRRPMPERPYRATRLGTLFHSWVEARYGLAGTAETLDAPLEPDADNAPVDEQRLLELQAIFERSPWASRAPVEVEREIHLVFDGHIIVCKIDAVYSVSDGGDGERFQVVDWKTGKAPTSAQDLEDKQLQLALYRLAYARWRGIDPDLIDAVFYYVADDRIITPERIFDEPELVALWRSSQARG